MNCGMDPTMLDAYVDQGLSAQDVAALEEHMRGCAECANEALSRLQMKRATRAAAASLALAPEFQMRPEFRLRVEQSLAKSAAPRFTRGWLPWLATAVVTLLICVVSVGLLARTRSRNQAVEEAIDLHVATLASSNPVDVVSTDRHTVKPWFAGRIPFAFNLPELQDSPYKLLGGKVVYLHNSPGAELLFELRKHQISVFIVQEQGGVFAAASGVSPGTFRGFNDETWSAGGLRYVVISDTNAADVHVLGDLLRGAGK